MSERIDITPFVATPDNPNPPSTPRIQASVMDPEVKRIFEELIVEIRRQGYVKSEFGGSEVPGEVPTSGVSKAEFLALQATVAKDLQELRKSIVVCNNKLDKDLGVADTDYGKKCDPPPMETRPPV